MNKLRKLARLKFLILLLPPFISIGAYQLDKSTKLSLSLSFSSFHLYQLYTNHFIHLTVKHLASNLIWYFPLVIIGHLLYDRLKFENLYWKSFIIVLLLSPLISSILWIGLAFAIPFYRNSHVYGLSGITSAILGLLAYGIVLMAKNSRTVLYLGILLLLFGVVSIAYMTVPYYGLIGFLMAGILILWVIVKDKFTKKEFIVMISLLFLYVLGILSIFPSSITSDGSMVNILVHFGGFITGYFVPHFMELEPNDN